MPARSARPAPTHLLAQPQRHRQALQQQLEGERGGLLVLRAAPPSLKAQRRQGGGRLGAPAQHRLCRLQLAQRRPGLARL